MDTSVRSFINKEWGWDAVGLSLIVITSYVVILCCILVFALGR